MQEVTKPKGNLVLLSQGNQNFSLNNKNLQSKKKKKKKESIINDYMVGVN